MAKQYVTGPAHLFVGVDPTIVRATTTAVAGAAGAVRSVAPAYLGTAERYPKISLRPAYEPTYTDQGAKVPHDMAFMGEEGFVAADISRWNEPVYNALASRPRHRAGLRGFTGSQDHGSLLIAEGLAYELWVLFPYASKAAFSADMPAGYHFHAAYLIGPDELEPLGTTPRKIRLMWHALRTYTAQNGSYQLYDHDMSGLPTIN